MNFSSSKTEWVKFGKIKQISFVGRELICIGSGCHMLFINLLTGEEFRYHADRKSTGEGIRTFVGHKNLSMFAFAEKCRFPKIYVMTCPTFKMIEELDKESSEDYISLSFSESEHLVALCDTPSFCVIVWNWRSGQKIATLNTDIFGKYQLIKCNLSSPVHFAQVETGTTKLTLWDIAICGSKCVLTPHKIVPPSESGVFSDILWTTEGTLFVLDMLGDAYAVNAENKLTRVIKWEGKGNTVTSFTWYKAGLTIAGPDGQVKHFKKSGEWICDWSATTPLPLKKICANYRDLLIGISEDGEILHHIFEKNNFSFIKKNQSKFNDVCMIYPMGQYFVTLQHNREIISWSMSSGKMKDKYRLKQGKALAIKENPEYPYVGVAYDSGVLELISVYEPKLIQSMASFNLSKKPLNSVYFTEIGKIIVAANTEVGDFFIIEGIPGSKMKILATVEAHAQICDYILIASRTCMRLFTIHVTSDLYLAGNKIVRYCVIWDKPCTEVKEYQLESSEQMYSKLFSTAKANRDRVFFAVPLTTKCVHELTTQRGDPMAKLTKILKTDHQMKKIIVQVDKYHIVTCAYDGLVIVHSVDFQKLLYVVMPHYRNYGGALKAYADPSSKHIVSLGRDNTLVGTSIKYVHLSYEAQQERRNPAILKRLEIMFSLPTTGFCPTGKLKGITWFEMEKIKQEEREQEESLVERNNILSEFKLIQAELQELLTQNLEGPENEKLDIQEFNLDSKFKEETIQKSREECRRTRIYLESLITAQDRVAKWIKDMCWDPMDTKGESIKAFFAKFEVGKYVLLPPAEQGFGLLECVEAYRELEKQMAAGDSFEPWVPKPASEVRLQLKSAPKIPGGGKVVRILDILEDEQGKEEEQPDLETELAFNGCISFNFLDLNPGHYSQLQICSFLQAEFETLFSLLEAQKLKEFFNKQFNDMKAQKVREMGLVIERNARLRHIISELNYFSVDKFHLVIEDPEWWPQEYPEKIFTIEDKEVGILPYISPSQQAILDAKAAEAERIRLLLLADDFRERALMAMMNGVLEIRWEDELRKDVPKPKFMLEKEPEEYNEDEIRAAMKYEEEVKFLKSERDRYKKMLEAEYARLSYTVRDGIRKFNNRLADFLLTKIQMDAGVRQEILKITRIRWGNNNRIMKNKSEIQILNKMSYTQLETEALKALISTLQRALSELRSNAEAIQAKDKVIEKAFKKDFLEATPVVQEQSIKLFKKRPKLNMRSVPSAVLTLEVAKKVSGKRGRMLILTHDCTEYLQSVKTLNLYVNIPPAVDETTYATIRKHRRLKIENELYARASALEIAEAEGSMATFTKLLQTKKDYYQKLLLDLKQVRTDRLNQSHDTEIQMILRKGLVEIPTTGSISDFDDAVMVTRKDVETINQIIVRGGNKKIKAMRQTMDFRRGILTMEWEHRRLKMRIADLYSYIEDIESIKVTKEIQAYLKSRARGDSPDKGLSFEEEVEIVKASYIRMIDERKAKVKELQHKIKLLKKDNRQLDQQIANVNVDVCEYQLERDVNMEKREKDIIKTRMATLLKRAKLIKQIQKNHSEILMLQTELELLRLKTYPTLSYKILS